MIKKDNKIEHVVTFGNDDRKSTNPLLRKVINTNTKNDMLELDSKNDPNDVHCPEKKKPKRQRKSKGKKRGTAHRPQLDCTQSQADKLQNSDQRERNDT